MVSPPRLTDNEKRTVKLHALRFVIISGELWWRDIDGVLLKCVDKEQSIKILTKMHSGTCGGHYMSKTIAHKVLRVGFWWPTLFNDANDIVRRCDSCQRFSNKLNFIGNVPLKLVEVQNPFQQWGLDFIGEIVNKSSG